MLNRLCVRFRPLNQTSFSLSFNRAISNSELATALRPFYFAVHPDLFGRHPVQRSVNEENLKLLSAHLEKLQQNQLAIAPKTLRFYIRKSNADNRDSFRLVEIQLDKSENAKYIIQKILKNCELSTEFIDKIKEVSRPVAWPQYGPATGPLDPQKHHDINYGKDFNQFYENEFKHAVQQKANTLKFWMDENAELARERYKEMNSIKIEVEKLRKSLKGHLKLKDILYECGWNIEHFRGCLKTLENLAVLHEKDIRILEGRTVAFAPFTGISLEGHVMLFTGDVTSNWLEFMKKIPQQEKCLKIIPQYEKTLSQILLNIKIRRRKFMPKQQVVGYVHYLSKLTTAILDYLTTKKFPEKLNDDLSSFEIVVESEAGPLMVSPTGQFITPSTCPGFILVDFITNNLEDAKSKAEEYEKNKHIERDLHNKCIEKLKLKSLEKDDSVTPQKMIKTLERLVESDQNFNLHNIDLNITNYYSVLADGTVCIPWDFEE